MSLENELRRVTLIDDTQHQPAKRDLPDDVYLNTLKGEWWSPMPFGRDDRRRSSEGARSLVEFIEPRKAA